jgi:hypothetical protein
MFNEKDSNGLSSKEIVKQAIAEVLAKTDENEKPVGYAFVKALEQYVNLGYKMFDLSWFKNTFIKELENEDVVGNEQIA